MSRRYDSRTTMFSPDGRLQQVEYAIEAISQAGTSIGIMSTEGIVLAAEKNVLSKLLDPRQALEKIFHLSDDIVCVVSGITADANLLIDQARLTCQRHQYAYNEPIPVELLVKTLCNHKHHVTQHGGYRPFGCAFLIAGWDVVRGFQLYRTDPAGNYAGWKATCMGTNRATAEGILKSDYPDEGASLPEAKKLLLKVLEKTTESAKLSGEKLEIAVIQRTEDKTTLSTITGAAADLFIKEVQSTMDTAPS